MMHDYMIEAETVSGRKFEIYGSFRNCVEASETVRAANPGIRTMTTRLLVCGKPVDSYIM